MQEQSKVTKAIYRTISVSGRGYEIAFSRVQTLPSFCPFPVFLFFPAFPSIKYFSKGHSIACLCCVVLNIQNVSLSDTGPALFAQCGLRTCKPHTLSGSWVKALYVHEDSYYISLLQAETIKSLNLSKGII